MTVIIVLIGVFSRPDHKVICKIFFSKYRGIVDKENVADIFSIALDKF